MAEDVIGRGLVEILPDFRKFGQELAASMRTARAQLDGSAAGLRQSAGTVFNSMAKVGKGVTAIGVGAAIASVKMAGDFQAETAVLQTAAGETSKGLGDVRKGILNISTGTGTGIKNLVDGMYTIEKAGFRGKDGLDVLRAAAQGAKEENASLADVTNAMTSVMASYHLKTTDSVRVMNALKTAAGEGKITMEQFSGALSTVLPIASANKISFEQVAGAVATLTQHGTSANEATQELAATIRQLAAPNNVAVHEMARFGLSAQDVSLNLGKRGLTGTIQLLTSTVLAKMGPSGKVLLSAFNDTQAASKAANDMISHMPASLQSLAKEFLAGKVSAEDWKTQIKGLPVDQKVLIDQFATLVQKNRGFSDELRKGGPASKTFTEAIKKMSGGAIGLNTVLQLSGESSAGFNERVNKVGESFHNASKDVEGWKVTQGLFNTQIARAKQTIQVLAIEIGTKLIPVITSAVDWFGRHKSVAMDLVITIGALAAAMAAAYIAQKLWNTATLISAGVQLVWNAALTIGRTTALGTRIELAALWVQEKAIAAATAVATAATWLYNASMTAWRDLALATKIQMAALWAIQKTVTAATYVATAAQWLWNAAMDANPITLVIIAIAALVAAIVYVATKTTWFQTAWKYAWNAIKVAFFATFNFIKDHWVLILSIITGPIGAAVIYVVRHWNQIVDGAKNMISSLGTWFAKLPGKVVSAVGNLSKTLYDKGGDLIHGVIKGATDAFSGIYNWAKSVKDHIVDAIKSVFHIHSPSVVMAGLGGHIMGGLLKGLLRGKDILKAAVKGLFHSPLDAAKSLVGNGIKLSREWLSKIAGVIGQDFSGGGAAATSGANQVLGKQMLQAMGWLPSEWPMLKTLWNNESGWRTTATNPSSGAYGIPQALPASKMSSAGSDWLYNPATQIKWGLEYIRSRYGTPGNALAQWMSRTPHWYDSGGWLPPGLSLAMNGTGKPERIRTASQEAALGSGGDTYVFNFTGPVGSQRELEDWLVKALDSVGQHHRVPASFKRNG